MDSCPDSLSGTGLWFQVHVCIADFINFSHINNHCSCSYLHVGDLMTMTSFGSIQCIMKWIYWFSRSAGQRLFEIFTCNVSKWATFGIAVVSIGSVHTKIIIKIDHKRRYTARLLIKSTNWVFHFFREEGRFASTLVCNTLDRTFVITMLVGIAVKILFWNHLI